MGTSNQPLLAFFELTTPSGEVVATPLVFPDMAWGGSTASAMARKMASAVQAHLIDKGRYLDAVQFTAGTALERCELMVDLPAGADPVPMGARNLDLDGAGARSRCWRRRG